MKQLIFLLCLFLVIGCKDDDDCQGIDCLPAATQTGAGTFGCLVNGEPFVDNSGFFNCFYQLIDGEFFFGIQAEDDVSQITQVFLGSNESQIQLNNPITLNSDMPGNFYGGISLINLGGNIRTSINSGSITFTEFNTDSNIVSAVFEFSIQIPSTGETVEITEGRFDSFFTQ